MSTGWDSTPRMIAGKIRDVCGVNFPQMAALTP
jgi:hypothetical protein